MIFKVEQCPFSLILLIILGSCNIPSSDQEQQVADTESSGCDFKLPASRDASWSSDGTQLIFDSNRDGNYEIYIMDADGQDQTRLTYTTCNNYYPFFSPDGEQITFMAFTDTSVVIFAMNSDGSNLNRLTPENGHNTDPHWSPDGSRIVFTSKRDGNGEVYTMNADGSDWQRLTFTEANENAPAWSPDGAQIAFISHRDGNSEIYVMNADGSNQQRLTSNTLMDAVPRWNPDGRGMIFYRRPPIPKGAGQEEKNHSWAQAELWTIDLTNREEHQLTDNIFLDQSPVYSPNGRWISFTSCRTGQREVYLMNIDGSGIQCLTQSSPSESWRPGVHSMRHLL